MSGPLRNGLILHRAAHFGLSEAYQGEGARHAR
jgi:hypothetical protein